MQFSATSSQLLSLLLLALLPILAVARIQCLPCERVNQLAPCSAEWLLAAEACSLSIHCDQHVDIAIEEQCGPNSQPRIKRASYATPGPNSPHKSSKGKGGKNTNETDGTSLAAGRSEGLGLWKAGVMAGAVAVVVGLGVNGLGL
ncbi:hypothetical protein DFH27DRAFT_88427 [Peziza echinospora]|nr:hypothetical protein DFH27DRAFT_88427 [Peziza echinospora]